MKAIIDKNTTRTSYTCLENSYIVWCQMLLQSIVCSVCYSWLATRYKCAFLVNA